MTRRCERAHYLDPNGTKVRTVKFYCMSDAEADAVEAAGQTVPKAAAFIPALSAGPAFDSPEGPCDRVRVTVGPGEIAGLILAPPPCDGLYGYAESKPGEILAHATFEAATDGDECTSAVCAMTRGSGD